MTAQPCTDGGVTATSSRVNQTSDSESPHVNCGMTGKCDDTHTGAFFQDLAKGLAMIDPLERTREPMSSVRWSGPDERLDQRQGNRS